MLEVQFGVLQSVQCIVVIPHKASVGVPEGSELVVLRALAESLAWELSETNMI